MAVSCGVGGLGHLYDVKYTGTDWFYKNEELALLDTTSRLATSTPFPGKTNLSVLGAQRGSISPETVVMSTASVACDPANPAARNSKRYSHRPTADTSGYCGTSS